MAAQDDWEIHQVDIKSAYLYAALKVDIYMCAPPGYLKAGQERMVLKLKRSLPGLKQAGFEWSEELAGVFVKLGSTCSQIDQAVYFKRLKDEHTIITVPVDNMAVTSKHLRHITQFKDELCQHFEITDLGELNWLLGLKVQRDRTAAPSLCLNEPMSTPYSSVLALQTPKVPRRPWTPRHNCLMLTHPQLMPSTRQCRMSLTSGQSAH
jgi:hypothetical protein